jgi:hypothetical protein
MKSKGNQKTRAKRMKNISLIDCVGVGLQSVIAYTYIVSRM